MKSKKNLILLLIFVLTLFLTVGHFAYTWCTDPSSLKFPMMGLWEGLR